MKYPALQCSAHRKTGDRCKAFAVKGATVCRSHGGSAPQVKESARYRVLQYADDVAAELIRLALHSDSDAVRVRACGMVLDYCGLQPVHKVEVSEITDDMIEREIARLLTEMRELDEKLMHGDE